MCIEADIKYAEGMLKTNPKAPRYLGWLDAAKSQAAETRAQLHELKDPVDQLQYKGNRPRKLIENKKSGMFRFGWLTKKKKPENAYCSLRSAYLI